MRFHYFSVFLKGWEGLLYAPFEVAISIQNEIDLVKTWNPTCTYCEVINKKYTHY